MGARQRRVKALKKSGRGVSSSATANAKGEMVPGTKDVAQRMVAAEEDFIGTVQEITGCTREEGLKALNTLRKLNLVTLQQGIGRYMVKHGAFMEADALRRAIAYP